MSENEDLDGARTDQRKCPCRYGKGGCSFEGTFTQVMQHASKAHPAPPVSGRYVYDPDITIENGPGLHDWPASQTAWFPPAE